MEFAFSQAQESFRQEVRDFCTRESQAAPGASGGLKAGYSDAFYGGLAQKGWLGLQIPKKYGGQGKDAIYEAIFGEEMGYCGAPAGNYTGTVLEFGNLILRCGTERQRQEYLPRIVKGEIKAGHAYTEPEVGCDLASVQTRAVLQGDHYVINGQKMFASEVHQTDYSILMARTDPNVPVEKGVSLFIMDNKAPGISFSAMTTLPGKRTNQLFLDNLRIPRENLIGEANKGWDYFITIRDDYWCKNQGYYCGHLQRLFERIVRYIKETGDRGRPLSQDTLVRQRVARMATDLRITRLLTYRLAWMLSQGLEALAFISVVTAFTDEALIRFGEDAIEMLGLSGQLAGGSKHAPLGGMLEGAYRENSLRHFGSLGPWIARNFVAVYGLGLPESGRGADKNGL